MTTVAVIAMGEMGAGIAQRLVDRGARVVTSLQGRSAESETRARAAGAEPVQDEALVDGVDFFLSILPPSKAGELAERILPLLRKAGKPPVYLDCNAIAPQTLQGISRPFLDAGLPFLDAGIIGAPPKKDGSAPRIYVSGPDAGRADRLRELGLDIRLVSGELGDASALKMAYAGITKGFQALASGMVVGAWRNGVGEAFATELQASQPHLHAWLLRQLPIMYAKAYRWVGEMEEISAFLQPEKGPAAMLTGAAKVYSAIAEDRKQGADAGRIGILNEFVYHKA